MVSNQPLNSLRCWGKTGTTDQPASIFHPAVYHMLDVGQIARGLLRPPASNRWRRVMARTLNAPKEGLEEWLPLVVALHDIGKISSTFQQKDLSQATRLRAEGFDLGSALDIYHTLAGQVALKTDLKEMLGSMPLSFLNAWEDDIGGHHGTFSRASEITNTRAELMEEPSIWRELRQQATRFLIQQLGWQLPNNWVGPTNISAAAVALTGFTILCDWLGSDSFYFQPSADVAPEEYQHLNLERAQLALNAAGFYVACTSEVGTDFKIVFPQKESRPLQKAIDCISVDILSQPCLAIIEAPTGEGKTEAALTLVHRIAQANGSDEFYYALPTTATSNQMFGRVESYLQENLHLGLYVKLIHGQAFLIKDDLQHIQTLPGGNDQTSPDLSWFAPRKRALLAPFGVGTVDQAELGALNVRHFALRMAGLAGKVLILDEVHAYDMYMTAIIERLLKWLACLGTSVILLSATLPSEKRKSLMAAYGIENSVPLDRMQTYPSLWVGSTAGVHHTDPPVFQPDRKIKLEFLSLADDSAVQKAHWLVDHIAQGGCICWISNTVQRAQELFEAVDSLAPIKVQRLLIHSQFPLNDRQRLETLLTQKYGPPATGTRRPLKSIVIGTQVLEQSLDLDFDLMVTDLAPMDLILQRAGRLQRHIRTNRCSVYPLPCLYIYHRSDEQDQLDTHIDDRIYDEYILQKTWQALKGREWLYLPADYRSLIEAVYDPQPPAMDDSLYPAWKKLHCGNLHDRSEAEIRLIPAPNSHDSICKVVAGNDFVESETRAGWIVAQTRLGERSVTVIPLVRQGKQARLPGREENWLDISCPTDRATELELLQHQLRISRWNAVKALESVKLPPLFSHSTLLKDFIPLWLDEQQQASLVMEKTVVHFTLDARLGLIIC